MRFDQYTMRDLNTISTIITAATTSGLDLPGLATIIAGEMDIRLADIAVSTPRPAASRRPDNLTECPVCGSPAVIVSLAQADRTSTATHAIQCQNRPATDQPWRDGMCGHTEYIVRSER